MVSRFMMSEMHTALGQSRLINLVSHPFYLFRYSDYPDYTALNISTMSKLTQVGQAYPGDETIVVSLLGTSGRP